MISSSPWKKIIWPNSCPSYSLSQSDSGDTREEFERW